MDLTPLTDLEHERSRTGPVRDQRPVYVDPMPPCFEQCPVHSIEMIPDAAPDPAHAFVAPSDPILAMG